MVAAEQALIGDLGRDVVGRRGGAAFLQLDELVQATRPRTADGHATGGDIHDLDAVIAHDVVAIATEEMQGTQRLAHPLLSMAPIVPGGPHGFREVGKTCRARLRENHAAAFMVDLEILALDESAGQAEGVGVIGGIELVVRRARENQRHARLVDENAVRLVHDGHAQSAQ